MRCLICDPILAPDTLTTKLTTLNPRWILGMPLTTPAGVGQSSDRDCTAGRYGMGISFDCPLHMDLKSSRQSRHRISIFFANPLDGLAAERGVPLWNRTGGSFKVLTISPSGDARPVCWNGFITNGVIS